MQKKPKLKRPEGEATTKQPRAKAEQVCLTRPARAGRRSHTPADLRRIYRYVVGSHGYEAATCAILKESGIQELLEETGETISAEVPCEDALDLGVLADWVPDDADEELGLPEGTIVRALRGCEGEGSSGGLGIGALLRVALGVLILVWGIWKKVSATRLFRFVLRRFIITAAVVIALDSLAGFLARAIPVIILVGDVLDLIGGVCNGEETGDDPNGSDQEGT